MRTIKFIVFDTKQNLFVENIPMKESWMDSDSWDGAEDLWNEAYFWQTPETYEGRLIWFQYTGAEDINNKEAFEGDTVMNVETGEEYEIVYDEDKLQWRLINTKGKGHMSLIIYEKKYLKNFRITGNKYGDREKAKSYF